jgi:hypothetical protein
VHGIELTAGPIPRDRGRPSAQAAQLLVHEHEYVVLMLLQQGGVQGTAVLQGAGQESQYFLHQGSHLLSLAIGHEKLHGALMALFGAQMAGN